MALRASILAVMLVVWILATAPHSLASDKLSAPGTTKGQETTVTMRPDDEAGEFGRQSLDILDNGAATCERLKLEGAIFAPVVGRVTFTNVDFGSCLYLGKQAHLNTSSCDVVITGGGLGILKNQEGGRCDFRIEIPGCAVHLGRGAFLELGYHNVGPPAEVTVITEPIGIGGTAIGPACLSPGPFAIGQYKGGYLRLDASRDGAKQSFTIIL